jgi:exodeoxyribonuclease V alpha subunit
MDIIQKLVETGSYSELDLHFGRFMGELSEYDEESIVAMSAILVSSYRRKGDVCLDIGRLAGSTLSAGLHEEDTIICPGLTAWRTKLLASRVVGSPGEMLPMILDEKDRLYLQRYWSYEKNLSELIKTRTMGTCVQDVDQELLRAHLRKHFPEAADDRIDWQMIAAAVAALKRFCVISGGPGTGKTYAVAKILALILGQPRHQGWRIFLCAPTGKAAARLAESIADAKMNLACAPDVIQTIPEEGQTIHRMLKTVKGTPYFHYNAENKLPADIVVVDEASMVDLPLMSKLIQAIPDDARLILMGDRDQLASVEAGSVLGDICGKKQQNEFSKSFGMKIRNLTESGAENIVDAHPYKSGIQDSIVFFTKRYRFETGGGIHALSQAVNSGDSETTLTILKENKYAEIEWIIPSTMDDYRRWVRQKILSRYKDLFISIDPMEMLACMDRFRILCAVNQGVFGIHALNRLAESTLQNKGFIRHYNLSQNMWYSGKPIMIAENEYDLGLYNGDVGVTTKEKDGDHGYFVNFKASGNALQRYQASRLPAYHKVYAMTVHKSQGSEFDEVLLVLPDKDTPLLTRELLYTGITRARQKLSILGLESVIKGAVSRRIERTSGLRDALWG